MECLEISNGWHFKNGTIDGGLEVLIGPLDIPVFFEITVYTDDSAGASYRLLVNNTLIRDTFEVVPGNPGEYKNGLVYPGEILDISSDGRVTYSLKYIQKVL